jgi:hypothetical protein
MSGGFEKYVIPVQWFFNIYVIMGIPSAFTAYKMYKLKKSYKPIPSIKRSHRLSNLIAIGILIAIMEIAGYTFAFVETLFVSDNLDSLFAKIPRTVVAFYALVYVGIPLASSFYDLQLGDKNTLLGLIYKYSENKMHPRIRQAAKSFYRFIQVPI